MNNSQDSTQSGSSFVTFSNIPLDDEPVVIGYDSIPPEALEPEDITVVGVQFKKGGKIYYFDPGTLEVPVGSDVIIDTARGVEYGFCAEANHTVPAAKVIQPLRPLIRIATDADKRSREEFKSKEGAAFDLCQEKILERNLDMKLVSAEYCFDGSKILFYFTADGRVDFRELVKDLASVFRTRIELRQIGVRDEAKMMGGLGICGRPFCCKQFLDDFQPVSIKMAKTQNLSLNPTKISGTCGRLMCCLKYEQDAYESLIKTSPRLDSIVNTCDGRGTVTEVNLLKESVKVRLESDPSTIKCYSNCDICVLRNGKGKKNDPPIPDDIPPLPKSTAAETSDAEVPAPAPVYSKPQRTNNSDRTDGRTEAHNEFRSESRTRDTERFTSRPSQSSRRSRSSADGKAAATSAPVDSTPEAASDAPSTADAVQKGQRSSEYKPGRRSQRGSRPSFDTKRTAKTSTGNETSAQPVPTDTAPASGKESEKTVEKSENQNRPRNNRRHYYRGKKPSGSKPEQNKS